MEAKALLSGVVLLDRPVYTDVRGAFTELYTPARLQTAGVDLPFQQDNLSWNNEKGTLRGLHFQKAPHAQGKLVSVLQGSLLDIAVDIRPHSPTFGQHNAIHLSAKNQKQLYIPTGFAHGFCTLEPNTIVHYKTTAPYAPNHEGGLLWNDPALGIVWPFEAADIILSDKDKTWPLLADLKASLRE